MGLKQEGEDPRIYTEPTETPYFDKKDHLARSIANQPNHKKSKKVKGLMSQKELDEYFEGEGKVNQTNLGS